MNKIWLWVLEYISPNPDRRHDLDLALNLQRGVSVVGVSGMKCRSKAGAQYTHQERILDLSYHSCNDYLV